MTDSFAPPPRRNILLIVSLCLNVVLVAMVLAGLWRALHPLSVLQRGILSPYGLMREAPAERDRIRAIINAHAPKLNELRAASGAARMRAVNAIGSPSYSPDQLKQSLAAVSAADAALESEVVDTMAQSIATLSPDERKAVAARVERRNRSWLFRVFQRHAP
jgi:uncharacterized membrane protein